MQFDPRLFLQIADDSEEVARLWVAARAEHADQAFRGGVGRFADASPSFSKPTVALMVSRRIALPVSTSPASMVSIPSRSRFSANAASLATRRCTSSLKLLVRAMSALRTSDEFEAEFAANQSRGALKTLDRDVSLGLQGVMRESSQNPTLSELRR